MRGLPLPMSDLRAMLEYSSKCDVLALAFSCDRAAANFVVAAWFFRQVQKLPCSVLPHVEPCAAHGVSLAKNRCRLGQQIATALNSLSKQLRVFRFQDAFREQIVRIVEQGVVVHHAERPAEFVEIVPFDSDFVWGCRLELFASHGQAWECT